jgi:RNA polymerase sigma factor (sigma-70 family)
MATGLTSGLHRDVDCLFESGSLTGFSDRDLLDRINRAAENSAEAAFEALVVRHGPMVQRVCRNILSNPDDADDAFQATFLILVQQRSSIRKLGSVASWLYGVAARVSARARVDAARRHKSETGNVRLLAGSTPSSEPAVDDEQSAVGPVVQEEVRRLPEKYRSVVLLCYWEGLTQEQAASRLGCPIGTVRSRVARARDLLQRRLLRRGLTASAVAVATALDRPKAVAASLLDPVSPSVVRSSALAATRIAAGQAPAEVVSASVSALIRSTLRSLVMMKAAKCASISLVTIGFLVGGLTWAQRPREKSSAPRPRAVENQAREKDAGPARTAADLAHQIEPPDMLLVEVLEALPGRPISGERLVRPDGKISLGFYGEVYVAGLSLPEAKEKIVLHLKKYLSDEVLGLVNTDPETGKPSGGKTAPADSDRVFVDVSAYNSRFYYVMGEVAGPGRFPFTGSERVLDVVHLAGGLLPDADRAKIKLMRMFPKGSPMQVLPVDYEEISMGTDPKTNYEIMPFDRLVVPQAADRDASTSPGPRPSSPSRGAPERARQAPDIHFDRIPGAEVRQGSSIAQALERRLDEMDKKLDAILRKLDNPHD